MYVTCDFVYGRALEISVDNKDERDQNKALRDQRHNVSKVFSSFQKLIIK